MKKKFLDDLYDSLNTYICRNDVNRLLDVLGQSSSLNVVNSKFFNIAVESKNEPMVLALLNYFKHNQLSKYIDDSLEFLCLKRKMHDILEVAIEDEEITKEMRDILSPYINFDNNSDESDQDLSGFEESLDTSDEEINKSPSYVIEEYLSSYSNTEYTESELYSAAIVGQY